eukprot:454566_1
MGNICVTKSVRPPNKEILVSGYCRYHEHKQNKKIPVEIKQVIVEYVWISVQQQVSSHNIVSDEHIKVLSSMDIIQPRGSYMPGDHKLLIHTDKEITRRLKQYKKTKPKNQTIVIGELGMGMGFTNLLCYKMDKCEKKKIFYYDENSYYKTSVGGMNGLDEESSYKAFNNGDYLDRIKLTNIIDAANTISRTKQMLMGQIPFDDSDED